MLGAPSSARVLRYVLGLAFVLAAASPGCADRTALLVRVSSTLVIPDDVDRLDVSVRGETTMMFADRSFAVSTPWPHTVSIRPGALEFGDVQVTVTAYRGDAFVVRRVVTGRFIPGVDEVIEVELDARCVGIMCPEGLDCRGGACIGVRVDGGMPDAGRDAATDGGSDANLDAPCPGGLVYCGGSCIDPQTDLAFCGAAAGCIGSTACLGAERCTAGRCELDCAPGEIACGGACVDPSSDRTHCGADTECMGGTACATGELCAIGACSATCPVGLNACGDRCVDPLSDRAFCGAAADCTGGATCFAGEACSFGVCTTSCPAGQIACGGRCVDTLTDRAYCGAIADCSGGTTCSAGQVCVGGTCATSCPGGQIACGGRCVDTLTDRTYCGASPTCTGGRPCASGEVCTAGACVTSCPGGQVACFGRCIDPLTDRTFCGASAMCTGGSACTTRQLCTSGTCTCTAPERDCGGGVCVDIRFDPSNCGMCGRVCDPTEACTGSTCTPLGGSGFTGRFGTTWTALVIEPISSLEEFIPRSATDLYGAQGATFGAYEMAAMRWRAETAPPIDLSTGRSFAFLAGGIFMLTARDIIVFQPPTREWRTFPYPSGMDLGAVGMTITDNSSLWTSTDTSLVRASPASLEVVSYSTAGFTTARPRLSYDGPTGRIFFAQPGTSSLHSLDILSREIRLESMAPGNVGMVFCSDRGGHLYIGSSDARQVWQYTPASGRWRDLPVIPAMLATTTNCAVAEVGALYVAEDAGTRLFRLDLER